MTDTKTRGRPRHYSDEQLLTAIEAGEIEGDTPKGEAVKTSLIALFDIPKGINAQSLEAHIANAVAERQRSRMERLVAGLPVSAKKAAVQIAEDLRERIVGHMAEEFDVLRCDSRKELSVKDADLRLHRERNQDYEAKLLDQGEQIAAPETGKYKLETQAAAQAQEIASLKAEVTHLSRENDWTAKIVAVVRAEIGKDVKETA